MLNKRLNRIKLLCVCAWYLLITRRILFLLSLSRIFFRWIYRSIQSSQTPKIQCQQIIMDSHPGYERESPVHDVLGVNITQALHFIRVSGAVAWIGFDEHVLISESVLLPTKSHYAFINPSIAFHASLGRGIMLLEVREG